jgi:hypothetical protein
MLNYNPMDTPMVTNMKKLSVSSYDYENIDSTLYIQLTRSLMYLVNTRLVLGMCYILCMCVCGRVRFDNCI